MNRLACVVIALLVVAACKKQDATPRPLAPLPDDGAKAGTATTPPPDPTPPPSQMSDAEFDALMKDVLAYIEKMRDAVVGAESDCAKMATSLEQVVADNREIVERTRALDEDATAEDRADAWMKAHEAEIAPTIEALFKGLEACKDDPAVQAAMEKMGT